jgi:hypothetical protein
MPLDAKTAGPLRYLVEADFLGEEGRGALALHTD